MLVGPNCVVSIFYTLTNDQGEIMDQSPEGEPLSYLHGAAGIIPGLENELAGKSAGDEFKVTIVPAEAYGERREDLVQVVPRESLPAGIEVEAGMQLNAQTPNGPVTVMVTGMDDATITVDGNHPLAGQTLHFEGTVDTVREATEEELSHGHAH